MSGDFWVLYDPQRKTQTEKLLTEDAQFSLMKMKTKELDNFFIWNTDWPKWKKLREFLNSSESPFMSTFLGGGRSSPEEDAAPSALAMKPADPETEQRIRASFSNVQLEEVKLGSGPGPEQFDMEQFDVDQLGKAAPAGRAAVDFKSLGKSNAFSKSNKDDKYKIELLLVHPKGSMFRSIARDISLSGTFSERIVPDEFHHSPFDLIIINNLVTDNRYKRMTLKARVVITDSSIYLEYDSPSEGQKQALREMLDQYVQALKKMEV